MIQVSQPDVEELEVQMAQIEEGFEVALNEVEVLQEKVKAFGKTVDEALEQVANDFVKEGEEVEE